MDILIRICFFMVLLRSASALAKNACSNSNAVFKSSCDESGGEFLGLCGACVGGSTGRAASHGADRCGACDGDDSCLGCDGLADTDAVLDACGRCLDPADPAFNAGCTKLTNAAPRVLDKSLGLLATVTLKGVGISPALTPNTQCSLVSVGQAKGAAGLLVIRQLVEDGVIQLEVLMGPLQVGNFAVRCETAGVGVIDVAAGVALAVVDSRALTVTGANVKSLAVGDTVEMVLSVPLAKPDTELVTFAHDKNRDVTYLIRFVEIRDGEVRFNFTAKKAKIVEFGVAYTEEAAMDRESNGRIVEISITSPAPNLLSAALSDDVHSLRVTFDRNVDSAGDCALTFAVETLRLLGTDPTCADVADTVVVGLGADATVRFGSRIALAAESGVYAELSSPRLALAASGSVQVAGTMEEMQNWKPVYEVFPPTRICPNSASLGGGGQPIRISAPGQTLDYKWEVLFDLDQPKKDRSQRDNIIIWNSVRRLQRDLAFKSKNVGDDEIFVNSTILRPGVVYNVNMTASNSLLQRGDAKTFPLRLVEDNSVENADAAARYDVALLGSSTAYVDVDYYVRAKVTVCGVEVSRPFDYKWSVTTEGRDVDVRFQRGRRLKIPATTLQGGSTYSVSCTVTSKASEPLRTSEQASLRLRVLRRGLQPFASPSEITLGTSQVLHLDASASADPDNLPAPLAFRWRCRRETGGPCFVPEPGAIALEAKHGARMEEAVLVLPGSDLPVGTYVFTVEISKAGQPPACTSCRVLVIPGTPPSTWISPSVGLLTVNPWTGVTLRGSAWRVKPGCSVWWASEQAVGFQHLDLAAIGLGDNVRLGMEEDGEARMAVLAERDFPLAVPVPIGKWPGLHGDAAYKLRLSAFCPARVTGGVAREGHSEVTFHTNCAPVVGRLQVRPQQGEALKTVFTFSADAAYDRLMDLPLTFHFGYQMDLEQEPVFVGASTVEREIRTILPAEEQSENRVRPVLKVCDSRNTCTTVYGSSNVTTLFPKSFSQTDLDRVMSELDEQMSTQHYSQSVDLASSLLRLLTAVSTELFAAASKSVGDRMQAEIIFLKDIIDSCPASLQLGLDFLDLTLRLIGEFPANTLPSIDLKDLTRLKDTIMKLQDSAPARVKALRFKRAAAKSGFTPESVNTFLKTMEAVITNPTVDETYEKYRSEMKKKLVEEEIHSYMNNLCHNSSYIAGGLPLFFNSSIVSFSVQQLTRSMLVSEIEVPSGQRTKPAAPATVVLGSEVAEIVDKPPFCVGAAAFAHDYLAEVYRSEPGNQFVASQVFEVQLFDSAGQQLLKLTLPNATISLRLPVVETALGAGHVVRCAVWSGAAWDVDGCVADGIERRDGVAVVRCRCYSTGYFKVVTVKSVETASTSTLAPSTTPTTPSSTSTATSTKLTTPSTTVATTTTEPSTTSPTTIPSTTIPSTTIPSTATTALTTASATTETTTIPSTSTTSKISTTTKSAAEITEGTTETQGNIIGVPISNTPHNVSFRIEENFNATVGKEKEKFEERIRDQIVDQSKMPRAMVKDIEVAPGPDVRPDVVSSLAGITVTLHLVDTDVAAAADVIDVIAQLLSHGLLELLDLGGKRMDVPKQRITVMEPYREEDDDALVYGAISSMLISVTVIAVFVIAVLIVRKRRDSARKREMEASAEGRTLRYRRFHFEQSLDGSEASLARYRASAPSVGAVSFSTDPMPELQPGTGTGTGTGLGLAGQILQVPRLGLIRLQRSLPGGRGAGAGAGAGGREGRGSAGRLLTGEEIQLEDAGPSRDRRRAKNLDSSTISFDTLPGMPEDEIQ